MNVELVDLIAAILAALAVASIVAARHTIAEAWRPGSRLHAAAAQVVVTGGMLGAATFTVSPVVVQIGTSAMFVALLLLGELGAARRRRYLPADSCASSAMNGTPVVLIMSMWFWLYAVNLWFMPDVAANEAIFRTASGVALFVFVMIQRYRPISVVQFYSAALLTIAAVTITLPLLPGGFVACSKFKCNRIDAILQGPFNSGNLLGLAAAMCIALLLVSVAISKSSLIVIGFLLVILYATMSRTSLLALGAVAGLFAVDRVLRGRFAQKGIPTSVAHRTAVVIALCPMAVGMYLVFTSDYNDFSNRGNVWVRGRDAVAGHSVTGRGLDWWDVLKNSGYFGTKFDHFTHSEYLLIYFSGGIVGLALFGYLLYRITCTAILTQRSLAGGAVVPLTFVMCGVVETIWNPLTVDAGTWLFYALVATCAATTRVDAEAHPLPAPHPANR